MTTSPTIHFNWTELLGTWVIGAAMWVVADSYADDGATGAHQ